MFRGTPGIAYRLAVMFGRHFLSLCVKAEGVFVVDLEAVHAYVAFAGVGVAGDYARKGDEAAGILRPALEDGEIQQGEIVALDYFFAGAGGDGLGEKLSGFGQEWEHF